MGGPSYSWTVCHIEQTVLLLWGPRSFFFHFYCLGPAASIQLELIKPAATREVKIPGASHSMPISPQSTCTAPIRFNPSACFLAGDHLVVLSNIFRRVSTASFSREWRREKRRNLWSPPPSPALASSSSSFFYVLNRVSPVTVSWNW